MLKFLGFFFFSIVWCLFREDEGRKLGGREGGSSVGVIVGMNMVEEIWNNFKLCAFMAFLKKHFFFRQNLNKGHLASHFMFL